MKEREIEIIRYPQMSGLSIFLDTVSYRTPHVHEEFELLLIRMPEDPIDLEEIVSGLFDKDYSSPLLELVQAKEVRVETSEPLEWALDGEASGAYSDVTIKPIPKFLQLRS